MISDCDFESNNFLNEWIMKKLYLSVFQFTCQSLIFMFFIKFSPFGVLLVLFGHIFHCLFLLSMPKNEVTTQNRPKSNPHKNLQGFAFLSLANIIYIASFRYIAPSTYGVTFSIIILLYSIFYIFIEKHRPFIPNLYGPTLLVSILCIIVNILYSCPTYNNIGITELVHLSYSPVGSFLCVLYIFLHLLFFILSYRYKIMYFFYTALSLATLVNLGKLICNCIWLTLTIESQLTYPIFYVVCFAYFITFILYFEGAKKCALSIFHDPTGPSIGGFYFVFLVAEISSATIVFGDPMMLQPIPIAMFLVSAVLLVFLVLAMSCSTWPLHEKAKLGLPKESETFLPPI
ncbi:hypothetical protein TRFO_35559 [Tritrichomonas foetus]|uniref:Uncharacterized protein n=1 Tax=Tritrichomonas foetus TaxID=1144522 RepID=A0A1J4JLE4_9EUKA|nr:hypothetical protein TRFO_35559 [Tritrichomonas foetus]|eukprot:OHS98092.1 hypothetical protein TRFO_35559 [Tritrichomonas foetus]